MQRKSKSMGIEYNYNKPHEALGNISPKKYKHKMKQSLKWIQSWVAYN